MIEEWKDIKGYEGSYQVSNTGKVKSLDRWIRGNKDSTWLKSGCELIPQISINCYNRVNLYKDGRLRSLSIARLVAEAFLFKLEGCDFVRHKDGDSLNDRLDNLEWVSGKELAEKSYQTGVRTNFGGKVNTAKLTEEQVQEILSLELFRDPEELAEQFGVNKSAIYNIFSGRTWNRITKRKEQ